MAITITYFPEIYSSLHDELFYVVKEPVKTIDPVTYPNYKFVGDVYIGGVLRARIKKVPDPSSGFGIFNVGAVVRSYLTSTFDPTFGQLRAQELGVNNFNLSIQIKFGEEYGGTIYPDMTLSVAQTFYNAHNGHGGAQNPLLFFVTNAVASVRPLTGTARLADRINLIPYFPTSTAAINVTVTPVGGGIVYATTVTPTAALSMQILNLAPANLNALQANTINAATTYYTVAIGAQTFRFDIICEAKYTPRMVHFLNRYGGFESKSFNKVSRYAVQVTKNDYGKLPYTVNGSGVVESSTTNKVYQEARPVYASHYIETKIYNTDLLTDDEFNWLADLVISPMVYNEEDNHDFIPIVVKNTNYDVIKEINEGEPQNLTLTFEYGPTLNAQYR